MALGAFVRLSWWFGEPTVADGIACRVLVMVMIAAWMNSPDDGDRV